MRASIFIVMLLLYTSVYSQPGNRHFVQYPLKGYLQLTNAQKIRMKGFTFTDGDSLKVFAKDKRPSSHIVAFTSHRDLESVRLQTVPITSISLIKENTHALTKGAIAGALLGFGLGYLYGIATYEDKPDLTRDDNWEESKIRGYWHGLVGTVTTGITGALIGRVVLRKRYVIGGSKEKLTQTLEKIY